MHFSTISLLLSLAISSLAAPTGPTKRAAAVLTQQTYNEFSVSGGVAGDALAEVNDKFPIDQCDLAGVAASDLEHISLAAQVAEQAEVATGGFNDAIAAAGGTGTAAGASLQLGKIKNKVLKLQTDVLRLEIQSAQGKAGLDAQLAQQKTKLATNVALDQKAKGKAATAISFAGSD